MIYHQAIFHRYGDPMALLLKKTGHKFTREPSCFCGKYSPQRCERWKDDSSIPRKRQRTEPYCIIHCTDDNTTLISPNSLDSWKTLQKAGEIRDHEGILSVQVADDQIPNGVFYHRKCRSTFTHKHDLDGIKKSKNDEKEKEVEVEMSHLERRSPTRQGKMLVRLNKKKKES